MTSIATVPVAAAVVVIVGVATVATVAAVFPVMYLYMMLEALSLMVEVLLVQHSIVLDLRSK